MDIFEIYFANFLQGELGKWMASENFCPTEKTKFMQNKFVSS